MYTDKDHLLGHLLASALELMIGEKALIAHSGGCPHGFYADVYAPFAIGEGYFAPLREHMERFIEKKEVHQMVMQKQNAEAFLQSHQKKRLVKALNAIEYQQVNLLQVGQSFFLIENPFLEIEKPGRFTLDQLVPLERGGFRVLGHRDQVLSKQNYHLEHVAFFGRFYQNEFLWNANGCKLKKTFIQSFLHLMEQEGVALIDVGQFSKDTFKKVKELGFKFSTQIVEFETSKQKEDPFFGLKGLSHQTADRFFYLIESENVREATSSCLRLIEKWTKILGIRGNFTESDRGRISWMVQDPFGATFEGPHIERHPSGCLTGSLMGPLELLIAIHAEEKFTWNLENQESMSKSAFHKSV